MNDHTTDSNLFSLFAYPDASMNSHFKDAILSQHWKVWIWLQSFFVYCSRTFIVHISSWQLSVPYVWVVTVSTCAHLYPVQHYAYYQRIQTKENMFPMNFKIKLSFSFYSCIFICKINFHIIGWSCKFSRRILYSIPSKIYPRWWLCHCGTQGTMKASTD